MIERFIPVPPESSGAFLYITRTFQDLRGRMLFKAGKTTNLKSRSSSYFPFFGLQPFRAIGESPLPSELPLREKLFLAKLRAKFPVVYGNEWFELNWFHHTEKAEDRMIQALGTPKKDIIKEIEKCPPFPPWT